MKYFLLSLSICFLTLTSCTRDGAEGSNKRLDYNYLGSTFCKCAQPTIQLNQELKKLQKTDKQAFLDKLKEAGDKAKESLSCCKEIMKNHTSAIPKTAELKKALKAECAEIPAPMLDEMVKLITDVDM